MIVKCPSCGARFRLDREKLAGKRVTLRCARCRTPFNAELPLVTSVRRQSKVRVMIAHSDKKLCGTIRDIVEDAGFEGILRHSGNEVLAAMDALRPQIVVVDVALQGLYAFEVVDKVRGRPGLENVKIILLSSVYNRAAYKRSPSSLYGADDYIEKHHIPDDLVLKINRLLLDATPAKDPTASGEAEEDGRQLSSADRLMQVPDYINTVNDKIQSAEEFEVSANDVSEHQRAERLARIIVSDISLYNQERVDEGILEGNWSELLGKEIQEAKALFRARFPSSRIQNSRILEAAFLDLLQKRSRELGV